MVAWLADVWPEHQQNATNYQGSGHGFVEGPGNVNPWTEEIGAGNAAYCISAACLVPHHHGIQWWSDSQFGSKGYAYCPYARNGAITHGTWQDDHASTGHPCDLLPGDIVLYDWDGNGVMDHGETVVAVYADLTFDTVGYNVGHPEGCHYPIRRDRKYLAGRLRMQGTFYTASTPTPPPGDEPVTQAEIDKIIAGVVDKITPLISDAVNNVNTHVGRIHDGTYDPNYTPPPRQP